MASRRGSRSSELPERSRRVLALLVRAYIEHGEPVSSLWLAEHAGLQVSSATVRHILAQLEAEGYLHQPHTSAGRVPTDLGYRSYVDSLLHSRRPRRSSSVVEARLRQAGSLEDVLANVSHEVSRASHHVGFALAPTEDGIALKHIEFVAIDASRVLVVLVATTGQAWHKVVSTREAMSPSDLTQAANYLNREFAGLSINEIRTQIVAGLHEDRVLYDHLLAQALRLASASLDGVSSRLFVHGASSLLEETGDPAPGIPLATLRTVLAMIEEKHRLIQLLTEYIEGEGLTVVIGAEHTKPELRDFSLVASTYTEGGQTTTVGIIGPKRMRYSRAITAVEDASHAVSRVLGDVRN